jgi:esterase
MPDLLNHGSSPHSDDFSLESMADDVIETLDDAGVDRFSVMGHSLGGKIALLVALKAPERVEGLIVLDVAPKVYEERHRFIISALQKVASAGCESRKEADEVLANEIPQRPIRAFLLKNFVPTDDGYRWRINLDALDRGYPELVSWPEIEASFAGPSLVIAGGKSSYVTPEDEELFRRYLDSFEMHVLPEAGHWVHTDERQDFLAHLRGFLFGS